MYENKITKHRNQSKFCHNCQAFLSTPSVQRKVTLQKGESAETFTVCTDCEPYMRIVKSSNDQISTLEEQITMLIHRKQGAYDRLDELSHQVRQDLKLTLPRN